MSIQTFVESSLNARALFFTGKGGTGKTTLSLAIAHLAAQKNKRVTYSYWKSPGDAQPPSTNNLTLLPLDPIECFREYLGQQLKIEKVAGWIVDQPVLRSFLDAAPGLWDIVIAGKLYELWNRRQQDLLVIDLPSTGHATTFLEAPYAMQALVPIGFVKTESERIAQFFESPENRIHLTVLPEELPITESLEWKQHMDSRRKFPWGHVIQNQTFPEFALAPTIEPRDALSPNAETITERLHRERTRAFRDLSPFNLETVEIPRIAAMTSTDLVTALVSHLRAP